MIVSISAPANGTTFTVGAIKPHESIYRAAEARFGLDPKDFLTVVAEVRGHSMP